MKPSHQCDGTDDSIHCHQRIQAFQNMSSRNRKRDHQICDKQTHSNCFDNSSRTVSSEESSYLKEHFEYQLTSIMIADSISMVQAIPQEMSLKSTTFQMMQQWAGELEIDMMG